MRRIRQQLFWSPLHVATCVVAVLVATPSYSVTPSVISGSAIDWQFEYDDADRITATIDPAGRKTRLQYSVDKEQRVRKVDRSTEDGSRVTREFDESGRLIKMTDGAGIVSYGYDGERRLTTVQRKGAPAITYTYDQLDRITSLRVDDFYRVEYRYDFLGRLQSMVTPAGEIRYEFLTAQGQVLRTLPNGVKTIWQFAVNGQLERIIHADARQALLAQYTYQYRSDGLIEAIEERSPNSRTVKAYKYDLAGRLVEATGPEGRTYTYEYDQVGNMLKTAVTGKPDQIYTYNWAGQLTSVNGKPTSYDQGGNLTSIDLERATLTYRHNQDSQLNGSLGGTVSYLYDGARKLVRRTSKDGSTSFIPDPVAHAWRPLIIEKSANTTVS